MSQHALNCLIIQQNGDGQQKLETALQRSNFKLQYQHVNNSAELESCLDSLPELLFCPDEISEAQKQKLQRLLYQLAPDCIAVYYSAQQWRGLGTTDNGISSATLLTGPADHLQQQLHYLLTYARLRTEFRHCKHLLRIVEQRTQWLVDYAREAVAYVTRNQHLYANAAYLSLFGFDAEIDALSVTVSKLVSARHHKTFLSLSLETEQKVSLPNKLLLDMNTAQGKSFRAEVRFIPSVFRGQRCIQLHVHPLLDVAAEQQRKESAAAVHNPWKVRIPAVSKNAASKKTQPAARPPLSKPAAKPAEALREYFQELLNLRGSEQPALFAAQSYLMHGEDKIAYKQLLRRFKPAQRYQLDSWNLQAAMRYLVRRHNHPLAHQVWVELGDWVLTDKKRVAELLKFLQGTRKFNGRLIVSVNVDSAIRHREGCVKILPLLGQTGVRLALDHVTQHTPELSALLEISQAGFIRTHENLIRPAEHFGTVISENLQQLLERAEGAGYAVVVDGVGNVNMMNALCETNAAYLQGEVLDKFKR